MRRRRWRQWKRASINGITGAYANAGSDAHTNPHSDSYTDASSRSSANTRADASPNSLARAGTNDADRQPHATAHACHSFVHPAACAARPRERPARLGECTKCDRQPRARSESWNPG
ncbi:hypothetical protein GCM10007901_18480 [Dyella acidisoli]|uniref:Uncharacterized protein n=1 Tax=Dyella acidisoli TaxID=1867834 RepID=A0ABQ5XQA2_9GAMM|nr:hypothetical protein GCM10007901_18480 [Dyella acidisoli]